MKTELFTIYDKVAEEVGPIFQARNMGVAARYIREMFNQNKDIVASDYDVICLGTFDSEDVKLTESTMPYFTSSMLNYINYAEDTDNISTDVPKEVD